MVKFSQNDPVYHIVVEKLTEIISLEEATPISMNGTVASNLEVNATQTVTNPQISQGEQSSHEGNYSSPYLP